ncbi:MAG: isoprenylcysteine carboxylmethyltransferase family protein [Planctomycetota bacterium]|jgi:protein-S-isoprenylcysteine O-methyltransferase Ste14|nr:isoprenylcysteine carboxylmethyltransferase family protein [Planctomycetota bacterium]MDP6941580.1 isoprenylcysteine carboxylmethyltransferase family protein [Planctomycetota bacterium]
MTASKKPTPRKIAVYIFSLALVSLADPRPMTFGIGCFFVLSAWLLRIWAFGHLEKNQLMVTTGPYAHTRNPAYLGSFFALLGVALAAGNLETQQGRWVWGFSLFLIAVFFAFYMPRKFRKEYGRLQKIFGEQVDRHAENVPDFWPQWTPWRSGDDRRFSWKLVGENHEWPWGFVLAIAMLAVWTAPSWSPLRSFFQ